MTPHIEAKKGDYADTVLLPGDPLRAKWIAETFLINPVQVNAVRNCLGYTGNYKGKKISVQAGGMGMASNSIYITELYNFYDVETIIRVGSCGGIAKQVQVGDIVAAITASTDTGMGRDIIQGFQFSPSVDYTLLSKFVEQCPQAHVGGITSNDYFYQPKKDWWKAHQAYGVLAVEMETYMLYTLAAQFGRKALSVNTVADHFENTHNNMTPKQRETGFSKMVEAVLEI
jgi:purine-nucleoside phosphorylase